MNKIFFTGVAIISFAVLAGCHQKAKHDTGLPTDATHVSLEETNPLNMEIALRSSQQPATDALNDLATPEASTTPSETTIDAGPITKPTGQQIQQALKNANLYHGTIDGSLGKMSRQAIKNFQEQNNLASDGKVGPKTWQKLAPYLKQIQEPVDVTPAVDAVASSN